MEIASFLGKLKGNKEEPKKFLALELTDEIVQAAVWHVVEGKTELVTLGPPVEWDGDEKSESELVSAVDATISGAIEGLVTEPNEVVFGVASDWTTSDGLEPSKLALIKKICTELELKALGFVIIIDSVLRFLKLEEGTPATAIMIQVFQSTLSVSLVKLGQITQAVSVERGLNIVEAVETAFSELKLDEPLPSRILVFNSMHNLDTIVQDLISHDWQSKYKFLHLPIVAALAKDVAIRSVSVAGGAEVAKSIGFTILESPPPAAKAPPPAPTVPVEEVEEISEVEEEVVAADFGFTSTMPPAPPATSSAPAPVKPTLPKVKLPTLRLPHLKLPRFSLPALPGTKYFYLALAALIILIVSYFTLSWFLPRATVQILVNPMPLVESLSLSLDTGVSEVDVEGRIVPAQLIEHQVSGEESAATTGKKTIGDPAKGEVTIYNRTSLVKTFTKGTTLNSSSLKFTLDEDVVVASKSAGADYVDVPGRAKAKITAAAIGTDSNLKADSEFTIASFSKDTYVARNESSLSGGSSKEVQVVSKDDEKNLTASLKEKLVEQARSELGASSTGDTGIYILDSGVELGTATLSTAVGQEANEVILSLDLSIRALEYQLGDIETLVSTAITEKIPPGFQRTTTRPTIELRESSSEGEELIETEATVNVELVPVIDIPTLQNELRGAKVDNLGSLLSKIPGLASTEATISPSWLSTRLKRLPRNPSRITILMSPL